MTSAILEFGWTVYSTNAMTVDMYDVITCYLLFKCMSVMFLCYKYDFLKIGESCNFGVGVIHWAIMWHIWLLEYSSLLVQYKIVRTQYEATFGQISVVYVYEWLSYGPTNFWASPK